MKYIIALIAIAAGSLLIMKTEWFFENFGSSSWAEQHGIPTRSLYKFVGIAIILLALLGVSGILGSVILSIFAPLFGRLQ
ncbi:MAG TPA: hypothetical protein DCY48_03660 [Candidatus Magasanikbacteria bacterium]|nr:MAG: hypothetical protein A3I74_04615 [Candidatus Magasanikbacteria bacterium RIFCSPLOWO2_02_FULL_47_16]OGH79488.1 MAG: hypothetical protein A3C10_01585 [Candidatus Magasanikbacteria bacterium RIFCSPHIGHO2_02_FULL_48_18]OGH83166.1 MAG: hypothetical protein A3G08_04575 [Candidatus Magasanikbacteria bacterium RIFCSPLOWO2_12_FULL_47_9b]HAZ28841.1 hypothetical protein [Candidatus Magasanikbacteria bacterium]